jgi:hypothetical protein
MMITITNKHSSTEIFGLLNDNILPSFNLSDKSPVYAAHIVHVS